AALLLRAVHGGGGAVRAPPGRARPALRGPLLHAGGGGGGGGVAGVAPRVVEGSGARARSLRRGGGLPLRRRSGRPLCLAVGSGLARRGPARGARGPGARGDGRKALAGGLAAAGPSARGPPGGKSALRARGRSRRAGLPAAAPACAARR